MIPSTTGSAALPVTTGNQLFHVIVDDFNRTLTMDRPAGPNGIRLHYEMMRVARTQAKILRDFDVRAESREAALAEMKAQFPDYIFLGSWAAAQAKFNRDGTGRRAIERCVLDSPAKHIDLLPTGE
jgi:hypothetical protein